MKKYYNKYNDKSAYDADSERKNLNASAVSCVDKDIVYDGVNVETISPVMGDAVYHDTDKKVHFIKGDTVKRDSLPSGYTPIGVCGERVGSKIYIIHGRNSGQKFAEFFRWNVTGWNLDGQPHDATLTLQKKNIGTFTYTANTLEECASQLDTFLRANCDPKKRSIAYMENGKVILQLCDYSSWSDYEASASGLSLDRITAIEIPIVSNMHVVCGSNMNGLWNLSRALDYYKDDNSNHSYNPDSIVTSVSGYPVCLPGYLGISKHVNGDKCAYLRERFGEGEEGWRNYMANICMRLPYTKRMNNSITGKEATYLLIGKTVPNFDGAQVPLYPAAEYAASIAFEGVKGLDKGDWFGPNGAEFTTNARHWTLGTSNKEKDAMNDTLSSMGMSTLSCGTYSWLFARSGSISSWYAYSYGIVGVNVFYVRNRVVPMALYELCSE